MQVSDSSHVNTKTDNINAQNQNDKTADQQPDRTWSQWASECASAAYAVTKDLATGAADEIIHHPLQVAEQVAIGAGIAVGSALVAPEVALALGGVAVGASAYALYENVGGWLHAADVVGGGENASPTELKLAHEQLQGVGSGTVDLVAGLIGGGYAWGKIGGMALNEAPKPYYSARSAMPNIEADSALNRLPANGAINPGRNFDPMTKHTESSRLPDGPLLQMIKGNPSAGSKEGLPLAPSPRPSYLKPLRP